MKNLSAFQPRHKYRFFIGIDAGVHTGFALWDKEEKRFLRIETMMIHEALLLVKEMCSFQGLDGYKEYYHKVIIEDARKKSWYTSKEWTPEKIAAKKAGVGSVRRDAKIWEDALKDWKIDFELVAPKNHMTKKQWSEERFKSVTGWNKRTSTHARDAALLVFGY